MWCIQKITPEYRERMYALLDLYELPYDPRRPVIGIDEKPKQLIGEKRKPIPMKPGSPEKYDYEYVRNGNANIFMAVEPKGGKRFVKVTDRRKKADFVYFVADVAEAYPDAEKIMVAMDNLNTHKEKTFYDILGEVEARKLLSRLEFHYTPKHASWLNVAEIEIGVMDAECTDGRIDNIALLKTETTAWSNRRNSEQKKIKWLFTREIADKKLSKHYVS